MISGLKMKNDLIEKNRLIKINLLIYLPPITVLKSDEVKKGKD